MNSLFIDIIIILDFGTLYYTGFEDLCFGLSFRNFSNQSDYFDQRFELSLTFDFGVAMDLLTLMDTPPDNSSLTVAMDAVYPGTIRSGCNLGGVRLHGYDFPPRRILNYDDQGLTGGLGVNTNLDVLRLRRDYSYSGFGKFFNSVRRISIGIGLQ